ncbi:potentail helicase MOV-10 [Culex quinquefasciatus]|uniref:Potentail helicase MOV-10 n=1 Tax=Culex quinquefasciatus TaxID=7176 RepID=B0W2J4_CULQU|nr:potentail helicase MOV-10 [Culex quinquefasciatus]|eukprot:XP_001842913.1 potentail helicase MOV-10 [Culex quinquefasciatus]
MDAVRRDNPQEILRKSLLECHTAGELNPDGRVPSEKVFRRFQAELFNQYRKDVRLREFQALMQRSPLLVEVVQSEYRIDLEKLLLKKEDAEDENECDSVKSFQSCPTAAVEGRKSEKRLNLLNVHLKYVTTMARAVKTDFELGANSLSCLLCRVNFGSALGLRLHMKKHDSLPDIEAGGGLQTVKCQLNSYDKFWLLISCRKENEQTEYIEHYQIIVRTVSPPLRPGQLDEYFPKPELTALISNNLQMSKEQTLVERILLDAIRYLCTTGPSARLTIANYCDMLEVMIHVHDLNVQLDLAKFQADKAVIVPTEVDCQYRIDTIHFNALPTNLAAGDIINLTLVDLNRGNIEIRGTVVQVLPEHLVVELEKKVEANCSCQVRLQVDRLVCRLELQALDLVRRDQVASLFFPEVPPTPRLTIREIKAWFNPGLENNVEQQTAVRNIVNRTAYPLPYILFGPPGTGKTTTLVEAIVQICTRHPSEHILVTAQSNAACDELAVRLLNYLPSKNLLRFFSRSVEKRIDELPEPLKQISNLSTGSYQWPTWEQLDQTNVLICSLTTCGRLVQCRVRPTHFKHVFIDECGSASEPAALVALAGLVTTSKKLCASVVLAGDPHQLGPVVRSELADKMGLGMSMLERLMNLPVYRKDTESNQYNTLIISKLLRNFRSHETLLRFSNQRFYENELIALAPPQEVSFVENWKFLPNKNLPIILHTVLGENESSFGRSRMNAKEVEMVEFYLDFILRSGINGRTITQQDIGIISPYQLQVQQLKQLCERHKWPAVEVGSVEQYQGREKLIVLLSTVRSHTADVGFLNNVKRLNVAMTRAKALLVVIGNSYTLQHDANWFDFVRFCKENGAVVGKGFGLDASRIVERTKRERMFDALFAKDGEKAKGDS